MRATTVGLSATLLPLFLATILAPSINTQDNTQSERHLIGYTSEFIGRSWATKQALPTYPAEAIARNIQGVVEVGVGITDAGRVLKVRVPSDLDPLLRKAAVTAVKQWEFRAWANKMQPGEYSIFRLTFNFIINNGVGRVELYNPPYDTPAHRRMRGASGRDRTEWLSWADATNDN
jgi:TonB family protein